MKKIIGGYTHFNENTKSNLFESKEENGKFIVVGPVQRANTPNENGRIYPKWILEREVEKYKKVIADRRATGELEHSDSLSIDFHNVSHQFLDIWWDGDTVMAKVEILPTPSGNILKNLIKAGVKVGISSRGAGSVVEKKGILEVQDDYDLICWDFVSQPSTHGAFMNLVNESVGNTGLSKIQNKKYTAYNNINNSIKRIILNLNE